MPYAAARTTATTNNNYTCPPAGCHASPSRLRPVPPSVMGVARCTAPEQLLLLLLMLLPTSRNRTRSFLATAPGQPRDGTIGIRARREDGGQDEWDQCPFGGRAEAAGLVSRARHQGWTPRQVALPGQQHAAYVGDGFLSAIKTRLARHGPAEADGVSPLRDAECCTRPAQHGLVDVPSRASTACITACTRSGASCRSSGGRRGGAWSCAMERLWRTNCPMHPPPPCRWPSRPVRA